MSSRRREAKQARYIETQVEGHTEREADGVRTTAHEVLAKRGSCAALEILAKRESPVRAVGRGSVRRGQDHRGVRAIEEYA